MRGMSTVLSQTLRIGVYLLEYYFPLLKMETIPCSETCTDVCVTLHSATSNKTEFFVGIAMRTSNICMTRIYILIFI
jgi:hypothetical protein